MQYYLSDKTLYTGGRQLYYNPRHPMPAASIGGIFVGHVEIIYTILFRTQLNERIVQKAIYATGSSLLTGSDSGHRSAFNLTPITSLHDLSACDHREQNSVKFLLYNIDRRR